MKDLDKIIAAAKKQTPPEFPFSDEELNGILSKANKTKITDYSKSKTISKGVKAMTISGITLSLVLGICMLFSGNSDIDQVKTAIKAVNATEVSKEAQGVILSQANKTSQSNATTQGSTNTQSNTNAKSSTKAESKESEAGDDTDIDGEIIECQLNSNGTMQVVPLGMTKRSSSPGKESFEFNVLPEEKETDILDMLRGDGPPKIDTNTFELKGNVLHIYVHDKEKVNAQSEAIMLNSEEMEKLNVFPTECGFSMINSGYHNLAGKKQDYDRDSVLAAGYEAEGGHYEFKHYITAIERKTDLIKKMPDMPSLYDLHIMPGATTIIYRDVENDRLCISNFNSYYSNCFYKDYKEAHRYYGTPPNEFNALNWLVMNNSTIFPKLEKIVYHYDSKDVDMAKFFKYIASVFMKAKADDKEELCLLIQYIKSSNLKKSLPARYANMPTYDDMFRDYVASDRLAEINAHIKSELANAKNVCNKETPDPTFDDTDKEVLEPFAGMRYLELTPKELEALGIYITPNNSYIYSTNTVEPKYINKSKRVALAKYGYDTTQAKVTALYKYKICDYTERFGTKEEIIDKAIEAITDGTEKFDLMLFFADIDSVRMDKELSGYTTTVDSMKMRKHSPELTDFILKNKYNIDTRSYVFKYLEDQYSNHFCKDDSNDGFGLQNASEVGKYVVTNDNNFLIGLRRDDNINCPTFVTKNSNLYWTTENIQEKYDGLSFYVTFNNNTEYLTTNRKNIAPIRYNMNRLLASGDTLQIATVAYFYITHDFVSKLPERFRADLYKELDIMGRVTRGELLEDQVCNEIEKTESYFGLCTNDMDLFKEFNGWVAEESVGNVLKVKFRMKDPTVMGIKLYNVQGKLMKAFEEKEYDTYWSEMDYYSPEIVPGVYVMHFLAKDGRKYTKKFVVK